MATTVNLGKLRLDWRGNYSASSTYVVNDVVTFRSQQWVCIQNTTAGTAPTNTSFWTAFTAMFNNRGTWTTATQYLVGDIVTHTTSGVLSPTTTNFTLSRTATQVYYCIQAHTSSGSVGPIDASFWLPINRRDVMGAQSGAGAATGTYSLGVYSNNPQKMLGLPNRGILFENQTNYRGGGYKNTTDTYSIGAINGLGQCVTWGNDSNGSLGFPGYTYMPVQNVLTFPFYDYWRSSSISPNTGVHSTPNNLLPRVIQWEKSSHRNLVLTNSGEVFSWGYGQQGENGNGTNSDYGYPVRVGGTLANVFAGNASHVFANIRIRRIAMSGGCGTPDALAHCIALDESGNVWTWGYNNFGQLGDNATANRNIPYNIPRSQFGNQSVVAVWAFGNRTGWSMAVTADGSLYAWGYNVNGQLGIGNTTNQGLPVLVTTVAFGSVAVGQVVKIQALDRWNGSTGEGCTAILTSLGYIYTTGRNDSGWMGNGNTTTLQTWTNMGSGPGTTANGTAFDMWLFGSGGNRATILIRDNTAAGTCWSCGYNSRGQLGIGGTSTTQATTIQSPKIAIAGVLYNLAKVRQLAFTSTDDDIAATCVTDNGISFSIGENRTGACSNAQFGQFAGGYADSSGIENINSYAWQPVRAAPNMQGRMFDCMGFGNDSTNRYFNLLWMNSEGRIMISGSAILGQTGNYHAQIDSVNCNIMTTIPMN